MKITTQSKHIYFIHPKSNFSAPPNCPLRRGRFEAHGRLRCPNFLTLWNAWVTLRVLADIGQNIKKSNNNIKLHLTGTLQSNKVKQALRLFDVFHTLDREKLLRELIKFPELIKEKSFFIQINTGKEITKSGVFPENTKSFLDLHLIILIN